MNKILILVLLMTLCGCGNHPFPEHAADECIKAGMVATYSSDSASTDFACVPPPPPKTL